MSIKKDEGLSHEDHVQTRGLNVLMGDSCPRQRRGFSDNVTSTIWPTANDSPFASSGHSQQLPRAMCELQVGSEREDTRFVRRKRTGAGVY